MLVRNTRKYITNKYLMMWYCVHLGQGYTPSSSIDEELDSPDVGTEVTSHLYTVRLNY